MKLPAIALSLILLLATCFPAQALTDTEYSGLSKEERTAYLAGLIDMATAASPEPRSTCVHDWFFKSDDPMFEFTLLTHKYPNVPLARVLDAWLDHVCKTQ